MRKALTPILTIAGKDIRDALKDRFILLMTAFLLLASMVALVVAAIALKIDVATYVEAKANLIALVRIIVILAVLGGGLWFLVSRIVGTKVANNLVKAVAHAPMTLRDSVENLSASSWQGVPLKLPYSGTLSVTVEVVSGNKIDVFLADEANFEKYKAGDKSFRVFRQANKTQNFSQSIRLSSGLYYLLLRDATLGVLSSQASDIKVVAKLE